MTDAILVLGPEDLTRQRLVDALSGLGLSALTAADAAELDARAGAKFGMVIVAGNDADDALLASLLLRARARCGPVPVFQLRMSGRPAEPAAARAAGRRTRDRADAPDVAAHERPTGAGPGGFVAGSPAMRELLARVRRIARSDSTVLVTGETGTGKERIARLMHDQSRRRAGPLVCLNCAAVPDALLESELFGYERGAFTGAHASYVGKLALAAGGTLLLDEVGDMTLAAQAKVLRALETREVFRLGAHSATPFDVRVIASTNQDLAELVRTGRFRRDLYYRLNVIGVHLPPLRARRDDIPALARQCLATLQPADRSAHALDDAALQALLAYDWPGNVRELRNAIEAALVSAEDGVIRVGDLPGPLREPRPAQRGAGDERELLLRTLDRVNWNKSRAAQQLRWSRMTLYRKLARYRIGPATAERTLAQQRPSREIA